MQSIGIKKFDSKPGVQLVNGITVCYVITLGILTVVTHAAQVLSPPFYLYASVAFIIFAIAVFGSLYYLGPLLLKLRAGDIAPLLVVWVAGFLVAYLVIHLQPLRPFGQNNDDYYFLANPVYYIHNSGVSLTYIVHSFYSGGEPFVSASFLTAGPYQYIQAAVAYELNIDYLSFSYLVISPISAFMFPLSLYLLLVKFTEADLESAFGVLATMLVLMLLAETRISPGIWLFSRILQGKSLVVSMGICTFFNYSVDYLEHQNWTFWTRIVLLVSTLVGMSTTAIMVLPAMSFIIFISYVFTFHQGTVFSKKLFIVGLKYLTSLSYLILVAGYISGADSVEGAARINSPLPDSLGGYISMFINPVAPVTPVILALFAFAAVILAHGPLRTFVMLLIFLPLVVLNPWISNLLIILFRGVYFRMFYILPLFIVVGLSVALLLGKLKQYSSVSTVVFGTIFCLTLLLFSAVLPTSVVSELSSWASKHADNNYEVVKQVINSTPPGVILAPYPISMAMYVTNPAYPQLLVKWDSTDYLLWEQSSVDELEMRTRTQDFLIGIPGSNDENYRAFLDLIRKYGEIKAVVFDKELLLKYKEIKKDMILQGYSKFGLLNGFVIAQK